MSAKFPSKTRLNEIDVRNPYELAMLGPRIYVGFSPQQLGRINRSAHYQVIHCGKQTNPGGHWQDNGHKTFLCWGRADKAEKAAEAVKWATEYSGITEWVRDPFGGFQDAKLIEIVKKKLKNVL